MNVKRVHFIASDAHDCVDRTPDLSEAYKYASASTAPVAQKRFFVDNPKATLRGETGW
jgi:tyrosine-protein phosphatase YwqE